MMNASEEHAAQALWIQALSYLNGDLSALQVQELREQLARDAAVATRFLEYVQVASMVRETVQREEGLRKELSLPTGQNYNFDEVLAYLLPPDDLPPIELLDAVKQNRGPSDAATEPITLAQAASVVGYLFNEHRPTIMKISAIAAVLLFAVVLFVVTSPDSEPTSNANTNQPPAKTPVEVDAPSVVATISRERNAIWQSASDWDMPSVGDKLHAGDRLTLLRGTAQITTSRGAIANLQGPCAVEMLEGGNSLHLIHGQIVGICESEPSKGFLIRTTQTDITDLGTRFGVDTTQTGLTEVHIFEGEVKVGPPSNDDQDFERVLTTGQAIAARAQGRLLVPVAADPDRFAAIQMPDLEPVRLVNQIEGIHSIYGDLATASASPFVGKDASQWPVGDNAFVFHDFVGRLMRDTQVNVATPGEYSRVLNQAGSTIPADTNMRSYIVVFKSDDPLATASVQGGITFDHEVLGIITEQPAADAFVDSIRATAPVFSPGPNAHEWLDPNTFGEGVTLSADRRTITFQFQVKESIDTIRVLVKTQ